MQLRLVARLLERVSLEFRPRSGSAPPAPLVNEDHEGEEADCSDTADDWSGDPGFASWAPGVLSIQLEHHKGLIVDHYSPVDGVLAEGEAGDEESLEVGDEVGTGARLTGVARSWLICSWSVCICEE